MSCCVKFSQLSESWQPSAGTEVDDVVVVVATVVVVVGSCSVAVDGGAHMKVNVNAANVSPSTRHAARRLDVNLGVNRLTRDPRPCPLPQEKPHHGHDRPERDELCDGFHTQTTERSDESAADSFSNRCAV